MPALIRPDEAEAEAQLVVPAIVGRAEYGNDLVVVGLGGVVRQNQVQYATGFI